MLKVVIPGVTAFISFYTVCQHTNNFNGNVMFRLGRTAFTVGTIIIDYKALYYFYNSEDFSFKEKISNVHKRSAVNLLNLSIKNGGCFIKIGQHIGSLTYLIPHEYVTVLRTLHDDVPNEPFTGIYEIIKEELKIEPFEIFSEILETPIGTASLAQVHYGRLKNSNLEVAIKVQHKYVRDHSKVDLKCMDILFRAVNKIFPLMKLEWLAEETRKNLPKELNFILEGKNSENLSNRLSRKLPFLKIPRVFWDFTTEKLLVMEYFSGGKVTDRDYIESHHFSPKEISRNLSVLYCEMIFDQGFVHCDPHPGNILVCRASPNKNLPIISRIWSRLWSGSTNRSDIVLLDHGLYQKLSDKFLFHYTRLWLHMISGDEDGIRRDGLALGCKENLHRLLACMVSGRSWKALVDGIGKTEFSSIEGDNIRSSANMYLAEMIDILSSVPRQMLLILKTNDLLRGVEHSLMGTPYNKSTMGVLTMTRYCLRKVYLQDVLAKESKISYLTELIWFLSLQAKLYLNLFKIFWNSLSL